jgi:V8-like Glu-specific endopeptidase
MGNSNSHPKHNLSSLHPRIPLAPSGCSVQFLLFSSPPILSPDPSLSSSHLIPTCIRYFKSAKLQSIRNHLAYGDLRYEIKNPANWPFSVHGRVISYCQNNCMLGSGTIIGTRFVITAAHNIYSRELGKEVAKKSMRFIPAMSGTVCPYGVFEVKKWYYPVEYKHSGKEDYALLVLDRDISCYTGAFGLKTSLKDLNTNNGSLYGYPAVIVGQEIMSHHLWGMEGEFLVDQDEDMVEYKIDTSSGQSGAGVYIVENGDYYVIGVHVLDDKGNNTTNQATCMNSSRVKTIQEWISMSYRDMKRVIMIENLKSEKFYMKKLLTEFRKDKLKYLISLDLSYRNLGSKGVELLCKQEMLYLRSLNLGGNNLDAIGAETLSKAHLPSLAALNLERNFIGDPGLSSIAVGNMNAVRELNLYGNNIGHTSIPDLAARSLIKLADLNLGSGHLGDKGVKKLASGDLLGLKSLNLQSNSIGSKGAIYIASCFISLKTLNLSHNNLDCKAASALSNGNLIYLTSLYLEGNNLGPKGVLALASGNLTHLTLLNLQANSLGDEGARAISEGNLISLTNLNLADNRISDEGVGYLSKGNLVNLTCLDLAYNLISPNKARDLDIVKLREINQNSRIVSDHRTEETVEEQSSNEKVGDIVRNNIGNNGVTAYDTKNTVNTLYIGTGNIGKEGERELRDGSLENLSKLIIQRGLERDS